MSQQSAVIESLNYSSLSDIKATCLGCMSKHKKELKRRKLDENKEEQKIKKQKLAEDKQKRAEEKKELQKLEPEELKKRRAEKRQLKKEKLAPGTELKTVELSTRDGKTAQLTIVQEKPKNRKRNFVELTSEESRVQVSPENLSLVMNDKFQLRVKGVCPGCHKKISCFVKTSQVSDEDIQSHLSITRDELKQKKRALKDSAESKSASESSE